MQMDYLFLRLFRLRLDRYAKAVSGQEGVPVPQPLRLCITYACALVLRRSTATYTASQVEFAYMSTEHELFITTVLVQN